MSGDDATTLQNAIDLVANSGMSAMLAARDAVNAAYRDVPEGAVDMAAIAALETVRESLIGVRQGADSRAPTPGGDS